MEVKLQVFCSNSFYELISWVFLGKMLSGECHRTPLMTSQHSFRLWLGAVRQQAITWTNFDPDLHCHIYDIVRKQFTFFDQSQAIYHFCTNQSFWFERMKRYHNLLHFHTEKVNKCGECAALVQQEYVFPRPFGLFFFCFYFAKHTWRTTKQNI